MDCREDINQRSAKEFNNRLSIACAAGSFDRCVEASKPWNSTDEHAGKGIKSTAKLVTDDAMSQAVTVLYNHGLALSDSKFSLI